MKNGTWKRKLSREGGEVDFSTSLLPNTIHEEFIQSSLKIPTKSYRPHDSLLVEHDVVPKYEQLTKEDMHPDLPGKLIPKLSRSKEPKKGWYVAYEGDTIRPIGSEAIVE